MKICCYSFVIYISDQICQKGSYTRTVSRHTFYRHSWLHQWTNSTYIQYCWSLNLSLRPLSQACLMSVSAWVAIKWPHLLLASRQLNVNQHTTGWLVWSWIYLLCVTCGGENGTNASHLAVISKDIAFTHHFVVPCLPLPSHPIGVLVVLTTPVKNYLIWWAIQLVIQCTADTVNYLEWLLICEETCAGSSNHSQDTLNQNCISKYF